MGKSPLGANTNYERTHNALNVFSAPGWNGAIYDYAANDGDAILISLPQNIRRLRLQPERVMRYTFATDDMLSDTFVGAVLGTTINYIGGLSDYITLNDVNAAGFFHTSSYVSLFIIYFDTASAHINVGGSASAGWYVQIFNGTSMYDTNGDILIAGSTYYTLADFNTASGLDIAATGSTNNTQAIIGFTSNGSPPSINSLLTTDLPYLTIGISTPTYSQIYEEIVPVGIKTNVSSALYLLLLSHDADTGSCRVIGG